MFARKQYSETQSSLTAALTIREEHPAESGRRTGQEIVFHLDSSESDDSQFTASLTVRGVRNGVFQDFAYVRLTRHQLDTIVRTFAPLLGYQLREGRP